MKLTRYEVRQDGIWSGALRGGHFWGSDITDEDVTWSLSWLPVPDKKVQEVLCQNETISFWFTGLGDLMFRSTRLHGLLLQEFGEDYRVRTVDLDDCSDIEVWEDEWQVALSEVLPDMPSLGDMPY